MKTTQIKKLSKKQAALLSDDAYAAYQTEYAAQFEAGKPQRREGETLGEFELRAYNEGYAAVMAGGK